MLYIKEFSSPKTAEYSNTERNVLLESYIATAAAGDTAGIASLYEETKSAVYGFALSILKNTFDAEDVMHDTYIQVFTNASLYKPKGTPMPWILQITKNLAFMLLRKKSKLQLSQVQDGDISDFADFTQDVCDGVSVTSAMLSLGQTERQIVTLHAVAGLKHKEIARVLDIPLATVLSKYNRAVKKLKKILGDEN